MEEPTRRAIAYAAAVRISGRSPSSIYSYADSEHVHMSESYDHGTSDHISNMRAGNLYLHATGSHVSFNPNGTRFTGYDFGENHHYSGWISGSMVTIYDHGTSNHHQYAT